MLNQVEYYADPSVRERIVEYCGGHEEDIFSFTAEYLVGYGEYLTWKGNQEAVISSPNEGFNWILKKGLDIFRSLWDRRHLLAVLDIEYVNVDYGGEIYLDPDAIFKRLEPVYKRILEVYRRYGLEPLTLVTGQGYHFVVKIQRYSDTEDQLAELGFLNESLMHKYGISSGRRHRSVSYEHGRAYDGLGRVIEFFVYELMRECAEVTDLPLVTTDVAVGPGEHGREAISLDLSGFGDPLYMRDIRCAYSTHQKHKVQVYKVGPHIARSVPIQITVPRSNQLLNPGDDLSIDEVLHLRRHFRHTAEHASRTSCRIPICTDEFKSVIDAYRTSDLRKFHRYFDSRIFSNRSDAYNLIHKLDLNALPECIRHCLYEPNPHLLRPTNLQGLTRVMDAWGWHPRDIAAIVWSKYEDQRYHWDEDWSRYDPVTRANFYVRMFAGQIHTGIDKKVDFNCISQQEKGYCWRPWCGFNLDNY